jgi:hypothetical protein
MKIRIVVKFYRDGTWNIYNPDNEYQRVMVNDECCYKFLFLQSHAEYRTYYQVTLRRFLERMIKTYG